MRRTRTTILGLVRLVVEVEEVCSCYRVLNIINNNKKMSSPEIFTLVEFLSENPSDKTSIAVVPSVWLVKIDEVFYCKWPKKMKVSYVEKQKLPEEGWELFQVEIKGKFATLEEAKRKERRYAITSESETNNFGKGYRKRKLSAKAASACLSNSDSDSTNSTDSVYSTIQEPHLSYKNCRSKYFKINNEKVSKENIEGLMKKFCDVTDTELNVTCENDADAARIINTPTRQDFQRVETDEMCTETIVNTSTDEINKIILKNILNVLTQQKILNERLKNLEGYLLNRTNLPLAVEENNTLLSDLPLETLEDLTKLEQCVSVEANRSLFIGYVARIGGVDTKQSVRRALQKTFSNSFAIKCSWTGQKNNIKLKGYNVIAYIKDGIRKNFAITDHEFENILMDWFRYAKVRKERGHK